MVDRRALARLRLAERQGLKLAILCRTAAVAAGIVWFISAWNAVGATPSTLGLTALTLYALIGIASYSVIGTRFERWWVKYALYAIDILGVCAFLVVIPVNSSAPGLPQVIAFRSFGIYFLFPLLAMACLTLSWRLVAWSGLVSVAGWWSSFGIAIAGMEQRISWSDLPHEATEAQFLSVFLSPDFVGYGSRIQETGLLLIAAMILALAVHRARRVFLAQVAAEIAREQMVRTFGRFVPETIAERLASDRGALTPQVRHGVALVLDIEEFTKYADGRDPAEVISTLGTFLADAADAISAHEGVVISFTGDGLLAAFNTPLEIRDPERAALDAASDLLAAAEENGFRVRIGLAAGPIATGRVGSDRRQAFTIYGDTVNRAARFEVLAKEVGATVLADAGVAEKSKPEDRLKPLGEYRVRGFEAPLPVWSKELVALPGKPD
ncbi:adenylate/guanylate cyclase domain-containing protein [Nisaea acidiphila]|uniref:Adenylate/guanylate cyclase domain-containing protein n=1 Tax=Nisaea acidiphila TaxID=1862145 RepID=A0A9J7AX88_9PROT|nr:adenylate/guanylate cyclase domain-containing protein [Nisaea acidiphila]UUX51402.1 adenylate/guanylate cyclase domain-containing protein [Nisaea acidiphila]